MLFTLFFYSLSTRTTLQITGNVVGERKGRVSERESLDSTRVFTFIAWKMTFSMRRGRDGDMKRERKRTKTESRESNMCSCHIEWNLENQMKVGQLSNAVALSLSITRSVFSLRFFSFSERDPSEQFNQQFTVLPSSIRSRLYYVRSTLMRIKDNNNEWKEERRE